MCDLLQLIAEVGLRKRSRKRRALRQRGGQSLTILHRVGRGRARRLDQRQAGIKGQQALERRQASVVFVRSKEAGQRAGRISTGLDRTHHQAFCKHVAACQGDDDWKISAELRLNLVGEPSAPSHFRELIKRCRLHLLLLVRMGIQVLRRRNLSMQILVPSHRTDQRADIGQHRQLALVKE